MRKRNTPSEIYLTTCHIYTIQKQGCNHTINPFYLHIDNTTRYEPQPYQLTSAFILTDVLSLATSSRTRLKSPLRAALIRDMSEFMSVCLAPLFVSVFGKIGFRLFCSQTVKEDRLTISLQIHKTDKEEEEREVKDEEKKEKREENKTHKGNGLVR